MSIYCQWLKWNVQGVKVGTLGRQYKRNRSYVRLAHTSIFGLCFMSVCQIKSNCYSLIYSSLGKAAPYSNFWLSDTGLLPHVVKNMKKVKWIVFLVTFFSRQKHKSRQRSLKKKCDMIRNKLLLLVHTLGCKRWLILVSCPNEVVAFLYICSIEFTWVNIRHHRNTDWFGNSWWLRGVLTKWTRENCWSSWSHYKSCWNT